MTAPLLIEHLDVLATMNDAGEEIQDGYLLLDGGRVATLGAGEVPPSVRQAAGRVVDGRGRVALPGLINTHHHLYQSLTRAVPAAQEQGLFDWLGSLGPIWGRMTPDMIGTAVSVALVELLLSGCTTTVDHTYVAADPGAAREALERGAGAARALGMRLHLAVGGATLGERGVDERMLLDLYDWAARSLPDGDQIRVAVGPSSLFAVGYDFLREAGSLATSLGVPRHIHVGESLDERAFARSEYGDDPVPLLERCGWLGSDVWCAHAVHLGQAEIGAFASAGVGVAHCPSSNMRLGSGVAPLRGYLDAGVKVGLGVDGSASNDAGHMLGEARQALLLARAVGGAAALSPREALRLATRGGAEVLGRLDAGVLAPGRAADVAVYALDDVSLAGAEWDPLAGLVLSWPPRADLVVCGGRVVVDGGRVCGLDVGALIAEQRRNARLLIQQ